MRSDGDALRRILRPANEIGIAYVESEMRTFVFLESGITHHKPEVKKGIGEGVSVTGAHLNDVVLSARNCLAKNGPSSR
jgi:hypothetical protein